jgi:hypothetical protein
MSKYARLGDFLQQRSGPQKKPVEVSFRDLEGALGFELPNSARKQRTWWSNNDDNNVMTRVWKNAGFLTEHVDMTKERVVFRNRHESLNRALTRMVDRDVELRRSKAAGFSENKRAFRPLPPGKHHPLRGALKGTLRLVGGTDLTKPADPEWGND